MSDDNDDFPPEGGDLRQKLNFETGRLSWPELQRHFARGVVIVVARGLDLLEVAVKLSADDKAQFETWISNNQIWRANDQDALQWQASSPQFWSVVVAPWVLVQIIHS